MTKPIIFLLIVIISYSCVKKKLFLPVKKISIEEESCGKNCIGISTVRIRYFLLSDFDIKEKVLTFDHNKQIKLIWYASNKQNSGKYLIEYIYDDVDLSKYLSLNSIKKYYNELIYFNQFTLVNIDWNIKTTPSTKIQYFLNGTLVNECDSLKMNFPPMSMPPPATPETRWR